VAWLEKRNNIYRIFWRDEQGKKHKVKAFSDRRLSEAKMHEMEKASERGEAGWENPYKDHESYKLTDDPTAKPIQPNEKAPPPAHLTCYIADLKTTGRSEKYVYTTEKRLLKIFGGCEWKVLSDINADEFNTWRNQQTTAGRLRSATTINQYFETLSAFLNWCASKNRLRRNPMLHPSTNAALVYRVRGPKVRKRRALSDDEVSRVLNAASEYNRRVYRFALTTGLRRAELEDLRWGDIRLNAIPAHIQLRAEATKANRADSLPLRTDVAADLRSFRPQDANDVDCVFPLVPPLKQWKIDLMAARTQWIEGARTDQDRVDRNKSDFLKYLDKSGRQADFHGGTRKTFCTQMHRAGVPLATAMRLMRHTDSRLTMVDYCDEEQLDTQKAIESLPKPPDSLPAEPPAEGSQKISG
jgi:integrase